MVENLLTGRKENGLGTRVIAFVIFKGGVGKTANVVNIGAALAKTNAIPLTRELPKKN